MSQNNTIAVKSCKRLVTKKCLLLIVCVVLPTLLPTLVQAFATTGSVTLRAGTDNAYTLPTTNGNEGQVIAVVDENGNLGWRARPENSAVFKRKIWFNDSVTMSTSATGETVFDKQVGKLLGFNSPVISCDSSKKLTGCTVVSDTTLKICLTIAPNAAGASADTSIVVSDSGNNVLRTYLIVKIDNASNYISTNCTVVPLSAGEVVGLSYSQTTDQVQILDAVLEDF